MNAIARGNELAGAGRVARGTRETGGCGLTDRAGGRSGGGGRMLIVQGPGRSALKKRVPGGAGAHPSCEHLARARILFFFGAVLGKTGLKHDPATSRSSLESEPLTEALKQLSRTIAGLRGRKASPPSDASQFPITIQ